ncbi:hypothetical protein PTKIN_Ptkin14bG0036900 [Pterospermum kingtungense]
MACCIDDGDVLDVYIPAKRNIRGQKYGFVCFANSENADGLIDSLNKIWIGSYKLKFFLARSSNFNLVRHKNHGSGELRLKEMPVGSMKENSYANVVKGLWKFKDDSPSFHVPKTCIAPLDKDKVASIVSSVGGFVNPNHVQISFKDGILDIKIKLEDKSEGMAMEAENQDSRSSENLDSLSNGIIWEVESFPNSVDSWSTVEFSLGLTEEEIGGGIRWSEAQDVGNMDVVIVSEDFVETSSLIEKVEIGSDDWAPKKVDEAGLEMVMRDFSNVEKIDYNRIYSLEPIEESLLFDGVSVDHPICLQIANCSFEVDGDIVGEEEPSFIGPVVVRRSCLKVKEKDRFQSRGGKSSKSSFRNKKNKVSGWKVKTSKKEVWDMIREEEALVDGISKYSISDDDIRHRNEVILRELRYSD